MDLEIRGLPHVHHIQKLPEWDLSERYSDWAKLLRVTAYCIKFTTMLRTPQDLRSSRPLSAADICQARIFWLKRVQQQAFHEELEALQQRKAISQRSSLARLNPFLDDDKLIRVGGRLRDSTLGFNEKHPVVLPKHRISQLIIGHAHQVSLHGGPQLTTRIIRQNYWILGGRHLIRAHIHKCAPCIRERAALASQKMGDLPWARVTKSRPFLHTGVDYAGPLRVRTTKGRGYKAHKAYIAIFVCLALRAVHIELVSDYSSEGFIAAYQRFVSRRGKPSDLYSDQGTTFVGADNELQAAFRATVEDADLAAMLATEGTTWHFVPPDAPHFGGLWEAGVKSLKHHLRRVVRNLTLTFEELCTFLTKVEACLNSRPICPMSEDPNDLVALTPGHFLIGAPIQAIPEPTLLDVNENRLSRWQLVHKITEDLWTRWSKEYLHSLQQRYKWKRSQPNLKVNDLVLVHDDNLPPTQWPLARITQCHPGRDGQTRVVTLRTAKSTLKRPIHKLCPLSIAIDD